MASPKGSARQIIIDNVAGAGGTIGTGRAAKAPPDGYTLLLMHVGIATAPALYRRLPYDAINDLEPIGRVPRYLRHRGEMKTLARWRCSEVG
jgi:tripartite-type tricarboxylate transporter receptor subunit TctC